MIRLFDGNNVFRRLTEQDLSGLPVRTFYQQVQTSQQVPVVVWDGKNALSARRKIYPEYKAQREPAADSLYQSMDLLKCLLKLSRAIQVEVSGYEADDVLAHLARKYPVAHLHSNDRDLHALGVPTDGEPPKIDPRWIQLYKATVGDPSDNIPGIKGFGKGTWAKLSDEDCLCLEKLLIHEPKNIDDYLTGLPLSKATYNWLIHEVNVHKAHIYWRVVNFLEVSEEEILDNMVPGASDEAKAMEIMQEYEV